MGDSPGADDISLMTDSYIGYGDYDGVEDALDYEVMGYKLQDVLIMLSIAFLIILFLSLCWNCVDGDGKRSEESDEEPVGRQKIVVHEIRPGLIVVQGNPSNEETLRIAQEYDSAMSRAASSYARFPPQHSQHLMSAPPNGQYSYPSQYPPQQYMVPPGGIFTQPQATAPSDVNEGYANLIDLSPRERPPPYVPSVSTT